MVRADKDVIAEASSWVVIKRSGDMTAEQRASLEAWLSESSGHAKALAEIEAIASSAASLKSLASLAPSSPKRYDNRLRTSRRAWSRRISSRPALSAMVGIAASVAAVMLVMPNLIWPDLDVSTGIAETRILVLKDGSRLTIGPKSRVRVRLVADKRYVELAAGEAFFEVVHDINRPFIVSAGDTRVSVLGTKFDVSHNAATVSTGVLEGRVQVEEDAPLFRRTAKYLLNANQKIDTRANVTLLDRPSGAAVMRAVTSPGEWREGRLTYSDARLADVVADLNRYYAPGIKLADAKVGEMRLTTTFKRTEISTFFSNLPMTLPVAISRDETGTIIIAQRGSVPQKAAVL
jgi:transmembrane sensor